MISILFHLEDTFYMDLENKSANLVLEEKSLAMIDIASQTSNKIFFHSLFNTMLIHLLFKDSCDNLTQFFAFFFLEFHHLFELQHRVQGVQLKYV